MSKLSDYLSKKKKEWPEELKVEEIGKEEPEPQIIPLETPPTDEEAKDKPAKRLKIPSFKQWKFLLTTLSNKERKIVMWSLLLVWILFAAWGSVVYVKDTNKKPAFGGIYTEGVQGQPLYINPIIAYNNPQDNDLSLLIFSSLFRYNREGKLVEDLVDKWERTEDGLTYKISLKKDVKWHDKKPLTADDVVFTLNLIRNTSYNSPIRGNWEGIQVEKTGESDLKFTLKKAYTPFLHNLTFGILPKHLWENTSPETFLLNELNKKPVGSGMYAFSKMEKDKEGKILRVTLRANGDYYGEKPHLKEFSFNYYSSFEDILNSLKKAEINGIGQIESQQSGDVSSTGKVKIYNIPTTRVFAIFMNQQKSAILAEQKVREALNHATNKNELVKEVLKDQGIVVNTPLLPNMPGYDSELGKIEYNLEKSKSLLKEAGWEELSEKDKKKAKDESVDPEKNFLYNQKLKKYLTITLSVMDYPELVKTAEVLKSQWEKAGINLNIETMDTSETLQNRVAERNYEALLFGEVFQADPDPTPFWHSGSKQAPGLNLSMFSDENVDKILDQARQEVNEEARSQLYRDFQQLVINKYPAVFLFSPYYLYGVSEDYKGISTKIIFNQSNRLNDVNQRYLFTARTRK